MRRTSSTSSFLQFIMQFRFIARLGVLSAFLLVVVVRENARLFHSNATSLKLNATSGKMASYSRPQHLKANDADAEISTFSPPSCTADQLDMIYQRLPEVGENCGKLKGPCPISFMTRCPQASWLEDFYASQHRHQSETKKSFLAFNIGCNKGYDAVNLLRMGSNNPTFNRLTWKEAMPRNSKPGVCGQDKESAMALTSPASSNHGKENSALVYCIEPMPSTFLALQNATKTTGWDSHLKVLHLAMNNEDPSTVLFPKPGPGNLGVEAVGISNDCRVRPDKCLKVESSRLDFIMSKEQLTDKQVNVLLIDVEGFDFDVLQGGNSTLRNTEYVEFEFHQVGKWGTAFKLGKKPLKMAIDFLDELGFTCYWAGRSELWRITGCWQPHYSGAFWSNVGCANRRLAPSLLQKMETVFLETVSTPVEPKSPIDVSKFLVTDSDRLDTISLLDVDGKERYQLVVVDRLLGNATNIAHHTCVWLDPPMEAQTNRKGELQAAAKDVGCARMIAVGRKPAGVGDDIVKNELRHVIQVIAQNAYFMGETRNKHSRLEVHWYKSNHQLML